MALKDFFINFERFKVGLYALEDTTKSPFGSAKKMKNMMVTDRGGVSPRDGSAILGTANTAAFGVRGFFNFRKSFDSNELLLKVYSTYIEAMSKNHPGAGWFKVYSTLTSDKDAGFAAALLQTDNDDYLIFGNRYDNFMSWNGAVTQLNGALLGSETTITVDTNLTGEIYQSLTATANSATTVTVAGAPWATNQWRNLYVYFPGTGKIRKITGNTANILTFDTLGVGPGNVAFQVRKLAFTAPAASTDGTVTTAGTTALVGSSTKFLRDFVVGDPILVSGETVRTISAIADDTHLTVSVAFSTSTATLAYNVNGHLHIDGTDVTYYAVDLATTFTVLANPALIKADNIGVASQFRKYPTNPQASRFANYLGRMVCANVRSAIALDSGSTAQGYMAGGIYYVSKIKDPTNYVLTASRSAGDPDFQPTPYGGGDILDVQAQEEFFYVFKNNYIESVQYSQDTSDTVVRVPLKSGIGSAGRTIKGSDDIYFVTQDKRFTSIGRTKLKDVKPQTSNPGLIIKRILDDLGFDAVNGYEYKNRIYIACKSSPTATYNDRIVLWNKETTAFEGIWNLSAFGFAEWNGKYYYAESSTPNVYELYNGHADVIGTDRFAISAEYESNFLNLSPVRRTAFRNVTGNTQQCYGFYYEGYIRGGTTITFKAWKDFADNPFIQFDFGGTETQFQQGGNAAAFLGANPMGLSPLGSLGPLESDGRRHFQFKVYFPFQYGNYFAVGFSSNGVDIDYEVTRLGLGIAQQPSLIDTSEIKNI